MIIGAPTFEEILNQNKFNPSHVEWLEPEHFMHLDRYDNIPVWKFLAKLKALGVDVDVYVQAKTVSSVLFAQMDNPAPGLDRKLQKVLDFFEVQAAEELNLGITEKGAALPNTCC